jgi:bifunctional oligoribonuclease and PAP phosphatase NrnA
MPRRLPAGQVHGQIPGDSRPFFNAMLGEGLVRSRFGAPVTYGVSESRQLMVTAALESLLASRRAVLTTHLNADGDGTGSEAALCAWLRANGNQAYVVNPTPYPDAYRFLFEDSAQGWILPAGSAEAQEVCERADLAVVLDTGEVHRIGRVKPMIEHLKTLVIDHHPPGDQPIGGVSFRDPTASATGELVFDLVHARGGPWPNAVIEGIYVAILTDTGGFRFSNSTAGAHRVIAELVERGADPERVHAKVYGRAPVRRFQLLRAALETLEVDPASGIAWMVVPDAAFQSLGATPDDLEGLVDYPRSLDGVEVGLLFRQITGGTKISFRSNGPVDVNQLARQFGGGGHVRASGALVEGRALADVLPRVVEATRSAVLETRSATK